MKDPKKAAKEPKTTQVRICGTAGQGVQLAGKILGFAGILQGRFVSFLGETTPYIRGGVSAADVIISDAWIEYPKADQIDILIAMSQEAYDANIDRNLKEGAIIFADSAFVKPRKMPGLAHYLIPASDASRKKLQSPIFANVVFLFVTARLAKAVSIDALTRALRAIIPKEELSSSLNAAEIASKLAKKVKFP